MSRRNAVMATLSIFFLFILLVAMVLAVSSGITSLGPFIFGGFSYAILMGLVILAFPIIIFVTITIVLLVLESSKVTRRKGVKRWSRASKDNPTATMQKKVEKG